MKKIVIQPVHIDFKCIKFNQIEKMLSGMTIPLLRFDIKEFITDVKNFCTIEEHKPKFQLDQILNNMYHCKLAIDELNRRTMGDYKKNMVKTSLAYKVAYTYFTFSETKGGKDIIVELKT